MPELPTHPFLANLPSDLGQHDRSPDVEALRATTLAYLRHNSLSVVPDAELVCAELSKLQSTDVTHRMALARTTDPGLSAYGKRAAPPIAWCIAELQFLAATDERAIFELILCDDPAGLVAPFIANMALDHAHGVAATRALITTGEVSRLAAAGSMLFRSIENSLRYNREVPSVLEVILTVPPEHGQTIIASMFQHIALAIRVSSDSRISDAFQAWIIRERKYLKPLFKTAAVVAALMRESENVDVFLLDMLAHCQNASILGSTAVRRANEQSEIAFSRRFASVLDKRNDSGNFGRYFRDFEFQPLVNIMSLVGIDAFAFRNAFLELAADGYWRLVTPSSQRIERHRAIMLVGIGALVAARRNDDELKAVVEECTMLLRTNRLAGMPRTPLSVVRQVKRESALDLPNL